MSRLLFILFIVALIYWLLKSKRRAPPPQDQQPPAAQDMVRCTYCSVHLPRSEAILKGGKFYCSTAHSEGRKE